MKNVCPGRRNLKVYGRTLKFYLFVEVNSKRNLFLGFFNSWEEN